MQNRVSPVLASPPERARAVQAVLDKHGPEMDRRRELTPEMVDALVGQDLLRMLLPKSMGGQEVPSHRLLQGLRGGRLGRRQLGLVRQPVERVDGDVGRLHAARGGGRDLRRPDAGLAWGARHDKSKAIRVEGGYRLTGTWSFASGGRHTKWLGAHSAVQNPDGTPHIRYGRPDDRSFVFLRSQARIIDDWHVLGLRGTGSDSYSVEDLFVPDAHAPARDVADERREKGPIYPIGSTLLYASGFCSVTIGLARRMLDTYIDGGASGRHSRASPTAMANNNAVQREMAMLEARLSAARAFLHEAAGQVYDASAAGTLDVDLRMRLRLATTFGMNEATDVSIACYRGAGTTAISEKAPFERRFRDAMSASQHLQGMWPHAEMVGRHIIGTENVVQFV